MTPPAIFLILAINNCRSFRNGSGSKDGGLHLKPADFSKCNKNLIRLKDLCFIHVCIVAFCDLQVYVEFDDQEWEKREWVKVYEDFQLFLLEYQLVWAKRKEGAGAGGASGGVGGMIQGMKAKHIQWPALVRVLYISVSCLSISMSWPH